MQVARGACSAAGMPPLWPWRRSLAAIGLELPWREERAAAGPSDRELVAAAIVETVAAAAARQPLLVVLEDMHWSDPVSVLVAQAAAEAVAGLPLALLLTCRDECDEAAHEVRDRPVPWARPAFPPSAARASADPGDQPVIFPDQFSVIVTVICVSQTMVSSTEACATISRLHSGRRLRRRV
jgi:hypothetical protein